MMHSLSLICRWKHGFATIRHFTTICHFTTVHRVITARRFATVTRMIIGLLTLSLFALPPAFAMKLTDIKVTNGASESKVTLSFDGKPIYAFFSLNSPERVVLDVRQSGNISGLPLEFSGQNLLKRIRSSTPKDEQSTRLVLELTQKVKTRAVTQQSGNNYTVVLTMTAVASAPVRQAQASLNQTNTPSPNAGRVVPQVTSKDSVAKNPFNNKPVVVVSSENVTTNTARPIKTVSAANSSRVVVAIDAGHGGQDPGAIGQNGLKEKNVTISIARRLEALLNRDPMFKPVLTRNGDYFISVMGRSDVARKQGANVLISIHADAAPNRSATGHRFGCYQTAGLIVKWGTGWSNMKSNQNCSGGLVMYWQTRLQTLI